MTFSKSFSQLETAYRFQCTGNKKKKDTAHQSRAQEQRHCCDEKIDSMCSMSAALSKESLYGNC